MKTRKPRCARSSAVMRRRKGSLARRHRAEVIAPDVIAPETIAPEVVAPEVIAPDLVAAETQTPAAEVTPLRKRG